MRKKKIHNRKKRPYCFTIIELIIGITIMILLVAMLMPALSGALESTKKSVAVEMANALSTAVQAYESEYGTPPGFTISTWGKLTFPSYRDGTGKAQYQDYILDDAPLGENEDQYKYDILLQVLSATDFPWQLLNSPSTPIDMAHLANKRKIQFLIPPAEDFTTNGYVDPWGRRFIVLLDYNFDGQVALANGAILKGSRVYVYSAGPDGVNDSGGNDDVTSW